jgi:hypothetical protein
VEILYISFQPFEKLFALVFHFLLRWFVSLKCLFSEVLECDGGNGKLFMKRSKFHVPCDFALYKTFQTSMEDHHYDKVQQYTVSVLVCR